MRFASIWMLVLSFTLLGSPTSSFAQAPEQQPRIDLIPSNQAKGFHSAYLLHIPAKIRETRKDQQNTILVIPNNTGSGNDDQTIHEQAARRTMQMAVSGMSNQLNVIVLVPIFPRPKKDWRIYTHALDRDTMLTNKAELRRPDLQLLAMLDDAAAKLKAQSIQADPRVLLFGFSASGMFTNRFAFLHPTRIKAAAFGSPGGWPLAPVGQWQGQPLRYPLGVGDLETLAGKPLNISALAKVPLLVFMGDQDKNDSVIFRDSYEAEDEKLLGELFGTTPVARWPHAEKLYRQTLPLATFKLYPGAAHKVTKAMMSDLMTFFGKYSK